MKTSQRRERWVGGTLLVFALALAGCSQSPRQAELSRGVPAATPAPAPAAAPKLAANKPAAPLKVGKVVRGKVQAPPGLLKPAPRRTSFLDGLLISPAYALSGFVAVGDVEVGVWEGDDLARPIGQPLYTTYTNDYGEYELILPPAYEPTPQVVVQVVDPYYPVRRLLTGLIGQDLTLATEAAVSLLVDEARPVEVDVRVIPPQRVETVYVTVERQLAPVAPVIIVDEAPREVRLSRVMKRLKHNLGPRSRPVVVINEILVRRDEFRPLVVYRPQPVDDVFVVYDDNHWDDAVIVRTNRDRRRAVRFVLDRRISKHDLRRLGWHRGHGHDDDDDDDDDHDDDRRRLVIDHGDRDWWVAGRSHDRDRDLPFFVHSGKDRERGVRFVDYPNQRDGDARLVQYLEGRGRRAESGDRHLATRSADGRDRSRDAKARWAEFNRGRSRGSDGDGDRVDRQRHQRGSSPVVRVAAERDRDRQARRTNGRDRARSARSSDGDQRGREARRAGRQSEGKSNREARGRDRSRAREARRSDEQRVRARHVKRSNDRSRSGDARRSNDRDRSRGLSRSSERSKSREAKRSGERSRSREANRSRERSRSRDANRSGERSRSREAKRSGDRSRSREASRSRERGREANRSRERSRSRDASRSGERSRNRDGSRSGDRGGRNRDERGGRERGEKR